MTATSERTSQSETARPDVGTRIAWVTRTAGKQLVITSLPILVALALWQVVAVSGLVPEAFFPGLGAIFGAIGGMAADGTLWTDIGQSLYRLLVGVVIGSAIGTALGLLMGTRRLAERTLLPLMNFGLAVPGIALIPLAILWFGLTDTTIIVILVSEVMLVTMLNTWGAVRAVDQRLVDAGRTLGCRGMEMFTRVLLPGSLGGIIGGYRLGFSRAWRILVAGEMLAGVAGGLGYRVFEARQYFQADIVYAGILVIGIVGLMLERVVLRSLEAATVERWGTLREAR
ncbi:ABC transporter permease [Pseudonocardia sp. ICBG1034]|uniref:ABC transporter permease n=1 Tax=Pseudonocardia sp. ICBG1034 TaxID=2844381 RepID=UPI001CCE88BC|nr:ABC transporter permease [Pseudonocardia sp. ICBG1034]